MNILKKWYWQWLDSNKERMFKECVREVVREEFNNLDKQKTIREWVEKEAANSIGYTHFVSAVANEAVLIDALVHSINNKQIRRAL